MSFFQTNTRSSSGAGRVVAFIAAAAVGIWGVNALLDDKPASRTTTPTAPATAVNLPPLVKGAYYKAASAQGAAVVGGAEGPVQVTFSKHACVVVTNPSLMGDSNLVEINIPKPDGSGRFTGVTHRSQLVHAPECYERRM